ncbi:serine/threonine protein kinase [Nonomuraea sp. SYSU D8015]|uniref:serine/threonine protein kinase n=1 Tax=Nonomuraea sp. SYSU D8015 TaxID=2593644 RepID=UPI0016605A55|nr:serine/threonine-protein kinase [Nonomuraea sp. SYSU D8015]
MMKPLLAGDPPQVNGHRVLGRLGEGGQGVVYLGEAPGGRRVAIKVLGAGLDDPEARVRFRQEIEFARRVKAFCTAQVLATGEIGGTPYVVSEFVDGPSLAQVIRERGGLRGAELRRLAIGTLTALAAIHRAGVVHRDFKPGNVLLSRDGPRVIDFGISRALEQSELAGEFLVGTPPYMAPEQFAGQQAGPAADLFAWASTMVCAATGSPPFGTGDLPALINRIMHGEPRIGDLDGELRELVVRCLAKEPAARPAATEALLTLLGHPVPEQRLLAEGQQSAVPPDTGRRSPATGPSRAAAGASRSGPPASGVSGNGLSAPGASHPGPSASGVPDSGPSVSGVPDSGPSVSGVPDPGPSASEAAGPGLGVARLPRRWLLGAGALVVAAIVTVVVLIARPAPAPAPRSVPTPTPPAPRPGPMALTSTSELKIPDTKITLYENPADPVWVSSYYDTRLDGQRLSYVRDPATGAFAFFANMQEPIVSPGGGYVVSLPVARIARTDFETIVLHDRVTGRDGEIRTVDKPATLFSPTWAKDGRRLLVSVFDTSRKPVPAVGFMVLDPAARSFTVSKVEDGGNGTYEWGTGDTVLHSAADGVVRVLDLRGGRVRTFPGLGELLPGGAARTSLGTVITTTCPKKSEYVCFWDEATGGAKGDVRLPEGARFRGWFDEKHFMATVPDGKDIKVVMMDTGGRSVRVLAEGPATEMDGVVLWFTRR